MCIRDSVYPPEDGHPSQYRGLKLSTVEYNFVDAPKDVTAMSNRANYQAPRLLLLLASSHKEAKKKQIGLTKQYTISISSITYTHCH